MKPKIILDLCGGSGSWSRPYQEHGYDVRLVDIKNGHDVRTYKPPDKVYGILAAPPCTVFSNAGNRWERTAEEIEEALSVVYACLDVVRKCKPSFWCLENPIGKLQYYIGRPCMMFQPYEYGDGYSKRTCLWGYFGYPKQNVVPNVEGSKMWYAVRKPELRAITPPGFAQQFFLANR